MLDIQVNFWKGEKWLFRKPICNCKALYKYCRLKASPSLLQYFPLFARHSLVTVLYLGELHANFY